MFVQAVETVFGKHLSFHTYRKLEYNNLGLIGWIYGWLQPLNGPLWPS